MGRVRSSWGDTLPEVKVHLGWIRDLIFQNISCVFVWALGRGDEKGLGVVSHVSAEGGQWVLSAEGSASKDSRLDIWWMRKLSP